MTRALCLALALISALPVQARGEERDDVQSEQSQRRVEPRLPPVLPGEEVSAGSETMKVWSTGGSPTTASTPAPEAHWFPPAIDRVIIRDRDARREDRR